jgi:hypothetical protein
LSRGCGFAEQAQAMNSDQTDNPQNKTPVSNWLERLVRYSLSAGLSYGQMPARSFRKPGWQRTAGGWPPRR